MDHLTNTNVGGVACNLKSVQSRMVFSSILLLFFYLTFVHEQKKLDHLVPNNDEAYLLNAVKNLGMYGEFTLQPQKNSPNFHANFHYTKYWDYLVEGMLRLPFFAARHWWPDDGYSWARAASRFYFFLAVVLLIGSAVVINRNVLAFELICVFTTILCFSSFALAQAHFIRYYPFLLGVVMLCHFICYFLFTNAHIRFRKLKIITLAAVPSCFHLSALFYFLFWLVLISLQDVSRSKLKSLIGAVCAAFLIAFTFFEFRNFFHVAFDWRIFQAFHDLALPGRMAKFIVLGLAGSGFLLLSTMPKMEQSFFLATFLLCLFWLGAMGFFTGNLNNLPHRYLIGPYVLWLITLAISFLNILRLWARLMNRSTILLVVAFVFCALVVRPWLSIGWLPNWRTITTDDLTYLEALKAERPNAVIFLSSNATFFYNFFPGDLAFSLKAPPVKAAKDNAVKDGWINKLQLRIDTEGRIYNPQGEILIGTQESFCRNISIYANYDVIFFNPNMSVLDSDFRNKIKAFEKKRVSVASILPELCGQKI